MLTIRQRNKCIAFFQRLHKALTLVFSRRANYGLKERQDWDEAGMLGNRELTVALVIEVGT